MGFDWQEGTKDPGFLEEPRGSSERGRRGQSVASSSCLSASSGSDCFHINGLQADAGGVCASGEVLSAGFPSFDYWPPPPSCLPHSCFVKGQLSLFLLSYEAAFVLQGFLILGSVLLLSLAANDSSPN